MLFKDNDGKLPFDMQKSFDLSSKKPTRIAGTNKNKN